MTDTSYPHLALGIGLLVAVGLLQAGALGPAEGRALPLLTMLIVNEFGFFVTAIGAGVGIRTLRGQVFRLRPVLIITANSLLAAGFLYLGMKLWPL
jgi:hypothetical protein